MNDANTSNIPGELPIQPTGSGVADLEIAYEQMIVAEGKPTSPDVDAQPTGTDDAAAESEAHPT